MEVPAMRARVMVAMLLMVGLAACTAVLAADEPPQETPAQRDARMQWWREARFGLFIHWGVYSVPAGTYQDRQIGGIGEWIMNSGKIPVAEYKKFAAQFNPVKFNAEEWVLLAKEAGMKYIVITSKHHDGFAMFDSKVTDWDIVDATPFQRDPLRELSAACQKHGIKLGFYYSQAQDWCHPGGAAAGGHWDKAQDGDMDQYLREIAAPQVREILTNYGPIAILWWDTPVDMTPERAAALYPLTELQPGLITNNRLGGGFSGDSDTPEQTIPATGMPGRDWETCMTMNDTWGFKSYDHNWKPTELLIRNLVDIASKGGNYLLNVGPTSQGLIPEPSVARLKEVGRWMRTNGEAIYGTTASPFKKLAWGRCTKKVTGDGATLYLHVFNWPADGQLLLPGLRNETGSAYLLADPDRKTLSAKATDAGVVLELPAKAPDAISSVVVLPVKGELNIEPVLLRQQADGSLVLPAMEAVTHGEQIRYESGHQRDNLGWWTHPEDWAEWSFQVDRPGAFTVEADQAALGAGPIEVAVGDQKLRATTTATGDYGTFRTVDWGIVKIPAAGKVTLTLRGVQDGWQPVNVKQIRLKPAP